ncbi:MAG: hypothetical protein NZ866_00905 [Patescibacteria group bacterium]|nr:hypothetical protein [Patescibacteria group bacterium]
MFSKIDNWIINLLRKIWEPFSRISIFIVFFYFGLLKVLKLSPASPLVANLLSKILAFISFDYFIIFFGLFEMFIGISFILPRIERLAILLLLIHMVIVFTPLVFLPEITWQKFLVPTLEGQYIIKNLALISLAMVIGAHLRKKD